MRTAWRTVFCPKSMNVGLCVCDLQIPQQKKKKKWRSEVQRSTNVKTTNKSVSGQRVNKFTGFFKGKLKGKFYEKKIKN